MSLTRVSNNPKPLPLPFNKTGLCHVRTKYSLGAERGTLFSSVTDTTLLRLGGLAHWPARGTSVKWCSTWEGLSSNPSQPSIQIIPL